MPALNLQLFRQAAIATALVLPAPLLAAPSLKSMTAIHDKLDEMCRGWPGNDPHTDEACGVREQVSKAIRSMGYCLSGPQGAWHRC